MSKKRRREPDAQQAQGPPSNDTTVAEPPKKRKREVDVELIRVYDDLADEQESVRLAAAHSLLSKIYKPGITTHDQTKAILRRLFRGLCSSRKSARLGFSVALTELLSQIASSKGSSKEVSVRDFIDILEAQSVAEKGVSSQDERDHYFGRVFGAEAILKAGVLFEAGNEDNIHRLLDSLLDLAVKKPWLRQECGWVLFSCIATEENGLTEQFTNIMIEDLVAKKLIRTSEGLAISIVAARRFPKIRFPVSAWKHGDPLARKDVTTLADILKDARATLGQEESEMGAQGSARWVAKLHFAWDVVLAEMYQPVPLEVQNGRDAKKAPSVEKRLTFDKFWQVVIDGSLFTSSNSAERKAWGLGVWRKVFETAPEYLLVYTFTLQASACLSNSLKSPERHLQKTAQRVTQAIQTRLSGSTASPGTGNVASAYVQALLQSVSYTDYDATTKSKTLQQLAENLDPSVLLRVNASLIELLKNKLAKDDPSDTLQLQKTILSVQWRIVSARLRRWETCQWSKKDDITESDGELVSNIYQFWAREVCVSRNAKLPADHDKRELFLLPTARDFARERLNLGFEQGLKLGALGCELMEIALLHIQELQASGAEMEVSFEDEVQTIVQTAWGKLSTLQPDGSNQPAVRRSDKRPSSHPVQTPSLSSSEALRLLYCLLLLQIYCGEAEAVSIVREVLTYHDRLKSRNSKAPVAAVEAEVADGFLEILLSFASKPSKLLRRITALVFDAFAPYLTHQGLQALTRVLETKENLQGQQEMFQDGGDDLLDGEEDASDAEVNEVNSDVEVRSLTSSEESDGDSNHESSSEGTDDDGDDELAKFDAVLASALGTRTLTQDDLADAADTSSDDDMDDDQMMELDLKLAEVFRARHEQQSNNKKKEAKEAKENIVQFKNRVLDLLESYFKHQHQNPLSVDLLLPMLTLARRTQTKQLADRSCNILQQFSSRCKGANVPVLQAGAQTRHAMEVLKFIHTEAGKESSNAHSNTASLSSILVVKAVVKADETKVKEIVEIYAATRLQQLTEKKCRVSSSFFTDWNNWCQTAREKLAN